MDETCKLCNLREEHVVRKLKFWTIILSDNQSIIGRCKIVHNKHIEDLMDTNDEERKELWEAADSLQDVLAELFQPDLFNYAILGCKDRHIHLHVIPRYAVPRMWSGQRFDDHLWGQAPWPSIHRELTPELTKKLRDDISQALK